MRQMKTRAEAEASIGVSQHTVGGKKYETFYCYIGTDSITKRRICLSASSKAGIKKKIDDHYKSVDASGGLSTSLTPHQLMEARIAFYELEAAGVKISLLDCVKHEICRLNDVLAHPTKISEAYEEFFASKRDGADKDKTKNTTGKWVAKSNADALLSSVTAKDIETYLDTEYGEMSITTYNSHFGYLKTFFNWCANPKRRYISESPMSTLDPKRVEWVEPKYMPVSDVRKLFIAMESEKEKHPDVLAHAITSFFCGVRREEILRMSELSDAAKIHMEDETVRISKVKGYTRGRAPRAFQIMPNALAWMKSFNYEAAIKTISNKTTQRLFKIAKSAGVSLFRNAGRHSFITYHVAAFGNPSKTQAMVGTSAKMAADHYRGLASKRDGEAYFAIYPSTPQ